MTVFQQEEADTYAWNIKSAKDGWHTIMVEAYDTAGNVGRASVTVTVSNRK